MTPAPDLPAIGVILAQGAEIVGGLISALVIAGMIGALFWGFILAGRKIDNVVLQLVVGAIIGFGVIMGAICVLTGIIFAGCLISGGPSFH
jgi:hypothetical protein